MAAGSRMKNIQALIPIVGDEQGRQCGRDHTIGSVEKKYLRTHRERERHK